MNGPNAAIPTRRSMVRAMVRLGQLGAVASVAPLFKAQAATEPRAATSPPRRLVRVGPGRDFPTLAAVAKSLAGHEPAHILVDAGIYRADVAVWQDCDVHIEALDGPVELHADGAAAEGKAIWVVRRSRIRVQGITFIGCAVPSSNGSGIRFESGELSAWHCRFTQHQMGLLTGNDGGSRLALSHCEFSHSKRDGVAPAHNVYVGRIAHFSMTGCWSHHADVGHLVKSRAAENDIRYNLLADGEGGRASYELDLPDGGFATVVGNILQQGPATENPHLISFGVEGVRFPKNELWLMHNTVLNLKPEGGLPIKLPSHEQKQAGSQSGRLPQHDVRVEAWDNLMIGFDGSALAKGPFREDHGNQRIAVSAALREEPWQTPRLASRSLRKAELPVDAPAGLRATHEYVHPLKIRRRGMRSDQAGDNAIHEVSVRNPNQLEFQ